MEDVKKTTESANITSRKSGTGKHKSNRTIDSFFAKKPKVTEISTDKVTTRDSNSDINQPTLVSNCIPSTSTSAASGPEIPSTSTSAASAPEIPSTSTLTASVPVNTSVYESDIGLYIGKVADLDDFTKCKLLEQPWSPPNDYVLPHCVVKKKGRETKKYAQRSHLLKFHWLTLSHKDRGLYCKYCVLFASAEGGGRHKVNPLKNLVKVPLRMFDDLLGETGVLTLHEKNLYHKNAVESGKHFLITYHTPELDIANLVNTQRKLLVEENRDRLRPIVKTIIFCGQQNIPLRGHRDSGHLSLDEDNPDKTNDGLFRALLRFRVSAGDTKLKYHLNTASSKATYISSKTQNLLIDCCKEEIQKVILDRVKAAVGYSIIFDETTDAAHIEQISLSFRYLHEGVIREDFVTFANTYELIRSEDVDGEEKRLTGVALAHIVEDLLQQFSIDITKCVGVGTDSCSVMASEVKGAVQEILKRATNARWCPCSNHVLNNSLSKSSKVIPCRNTTGTMKKVIAFANSSPKRHAIFVTEVGCALKGLCETRWGEKHDGHLQFRKFLPKICSALEIISKWTENKTASEAFCLLQALRSSEFLISTLSLCDVLGTTAPLSRLLQAPSLDLKKAADAITDTTSVLERKRKEMNSSFHRLYQEAQELATTLDLDITVPRTTTMQRHRQNYPANDRNDIEGYFRKSIYVPLLDNILGDLNERFHADTLNIYNFRVFMPKKTYSESVEDDMVTVTSVARRYEKMLGFSIDALHTEFSLWVAKWKREVEKGCVLPETVVEAIKVCDPDLYPAIRSLLQVLATLPVSVATAERSFSTLRRLKTWLRSRMREERLSGLALLHIHYNVFIDVENIIDRFSKSNRKLEFTI